MCTALSVYNPRSTPVCHFNVSSTCSVTLRKAYPQCVYCLCPLTYSLKVHLLAVCGVGEYILHVLSQVSVSASGKLVFLREEAIVLGVVAGNKSFCALLFFSICLL